MDFIKLNKSVEISKLEMQILEYRVFYKNYLTRITNRIEVLETLDNLLKDLQYNKPIYIFLTEKYEKLIKISERFIRDNFPNDVLILYRKEIPLYKSKNVVEEEKFWIHLLSSLAKSFEELSDKYIQEWNYKRNFLLFLYNCIYNFGLHSNILLRDESKYKRFNLLLNHDFKSNKPIYDYKVMMSFDIFKKDFIDLYLEKRPIKIKGKLIPFENIHEVKVTTTLLKEDEIELFALKNNFEWQENKRDYVSFINFCKDETEKYHPNPFEKKTYIKSADNFLIRETINLLQPYKKSLDLYKAALSKIDNKLFYRNALDDLRLSFELLLKELFKNKKSLENQSSEIGTLFKQKNTSSEMNNMFHKLVDYYSKYQNEHVKHDDIIDEGEIEFVFEITSTFIKKILK